MAYLDHGKVKDPGSFPGMVQAILNLILPEETATLAEAADESGKALVDRVFAHSLVLIDEQGFPAAYQAAVKGYIGQLKEHIRALRTILMNVLFYSEGEAFSIEGMIRNAATLLANVGIVPPAHYNEVNFAWVRAQRAAGILDHTTYTVTEGDGQAWVKNSETGAPFVVKRITEDGKTFGLFTGIRVDGQDLSKASYTAKEGSLKAELRPIYLQGLAVGGHQIEFLFRDGSAAAAFTVEEGEPVPEPTTEPEPTDMPTTEPAPTTEPEPTVTPKPIPRTR